MRMLKLNHWRAMPALLLCAVLASCAKNVSQNADELVADGWRYFRLEEFDQAQNSFRAALDQLSRHKNNPALRINALYGLGMTASVGHHGEQSAAARDYLEQVIDADEVSRGGTGETAPWAALAIARDRYLPASPDDPVDIDAAKKAYSDLIARYPQSPAAEEAFVYRTALFIQTLTADDATKALADITEFLNAHPQTKLKSAIDSLSSKAHETLKDYPAALQDAIASVDAKEDDLSNAWQSNILEYYRIGMMAQFDVGDFATARKYYNKFLADYPRDQRAFNVQLLLKHLDDTEARLREGLPPRQLSELAGETAPHDAAGGAP